jgi:predicted RND superfamily exporter protein
MEIIMLNLLMNILFNFPYVIMIIFISLFTIILYDILTIEINKNTGNKKKEDKTIELHKMDLDFINQPRPRM